MSEIEEELRARIEELEGLLIERPYCFARLGLTPAEASLAGFLLSRKAITRDGWNLVRNSDCCRETFQVFMAKLRRKLSPYGIKIKTETWHGFYYMEPADKERLRTMAAA